MRMFVRRPPPGQSHDGAAGSRGGANAPSGAPAGWSRLAASPVEPLAASEMSPERRRYFAAPAQAEAEAERAASESPGGAPLRAPRADGGALEAGVRSRTEDAWGRDLSAVRVHAGSQAAELTARHDANAVTVGRDIHISPHALDSPDGGRRTLIHELAHVAQQGMAAPLSAAAKSFLPRPVTVHPELRARVHDGEVVADFSTENIEGEHAGHREQRAWFQARFEPSSGSTFAAAGSINWFQTVRTNSRGGTQTVRPEDEFPIRPLTEFVDGLTRTNPDRQIARFWDAASFSMGDIPGRQSMRDRTITWQAETSCVGITASGRERLITVTWGFTLGPRGRGGAIPLTVVASPTPYHLRKFGELPP